MRLAEYGYRVTSQYDEDGIIQYLVNQVPIEHKTFIEFGVDKFDESNCRYLLGVDDWTGLVMDSSPYNTAYINRRYGLEAKCAFVTAENINDLIKETPADLISIDIDGMDYFVWEAIEMRPSIVICEFNPFYGSRPVTTPYEPKFDRFKAYAHGKYHGASLSALCVLAKQKGYSFLGTNSAAHNAFFVLSEMLGNLEEADPLEVEQTSICTAYGKNNPAYSYQDIRVMIRGLSVVNVVTQEMEKL
jgi:hypothetical protein